jgi:L-gulonolactone oxidase
LLYFEPKTVDEIKEILKLADVNDKKVKVVGHGHSPSNIACTDDYMILMKNFNRILDVAILRERFKKT